ncbi:FAD-dependent oxidoreductase [Candidatus Nomurabacteria bacterium]|nr:FAD-dependent oxidoreductase [Candidatus Nomurabacteria bacterium]MCB9819361.1 FAD-dependent oxidoreductase [Candidatus Nomurabacteria bacterium]
MLDIISRACLHPIDYSGILRTTTLQFKEKIQETDNTYSFIFTASKLPNWKAGQHAIFTLPEAYVEGKTWRPFSVASAPSENVIRIGTIVPPEPSSFKQKLVSLQPGDKVRMFGPYGELCLKSNMKKIVAVAGGIGITPFRAIICDLANNGKNVDFHLIYSAKSEHVYKNELENWKHKLPNLKITYTTTADEVNAELLNEVDNSKDTHFLLSGAPGMIEALRKNLIDNQVTKNHIINDPFKGY